MCSATDHLAAMVVCVDYSDHLSRGLERWRDGTNSLLVVTAPRDAATQALCKAFNVPVFLTDVFWANGAKFNKGAAMAEAYRTLEKKDWMLFFDADIEPPAGWRQRLAMAKPGRLYGARRFEANGARITDPGLAGFFHLAHLSDPHMQHDPIVDVHWYHAGNYDTTFQDRWHRSKQLWLPLRVAHHGTPGKNWCGVGNEAAVEALHAERRARKGWRHETL